MDNTTTETTYEKAYAAVAIDNLGENGTLAGAATEFLSEVELAGFYTISRPDSFWILNTMYLYDHYELLLEHWKSKYPELQISEIKILKESEIKELDPDFDSAPPEGSDQRYKFLIDMSGFGGCVIKVNRFDKLYLKLTGNKRPPRRTDVE